MSPAPNCAGWAFVYGTSLLFFSVYRVLTLRSLITMYGTEKDATLDVQQQQTDNEEDAGIQKPLDLRQRRTRQKASIVRFTASLLLFILMTVPFVADLLLVRIRDMRFNFDLVKMAIHESNNASAAEISSAEVNQAYISAAMAIASATVFAAVRARNDWADLTRWSLTKQVTQVVARKLKRVDATAKMEEGEGETMGFLGNNVPSEKIQEDEVPLPDKRQDKTWYWR
ncbi:hypothetical protein PC128_g17459 [Phytophthora cactorum]|nr:hypothetical protein PC128_g17459 [Phytophthora cactorum]